MRQEEEQQRELTDDPNTGTDHSAGTTQGSKPRGRSESEMRANDKKKRQVYLVSSSVNIILPPLKLFAGITGHSAALIADAINSLLDICANVITYIFLRIASKPAGKEDEHIYGHGKYEIIASLFIALSMIVTGAIIIFRSIKTFVDYFAHGTLPVEPELVAAWVAVATVVIKLLAYYYTEHQSRGTHSDALHAQAMDHRSDVWSASAVVVGILGARLIPGIGVLFEPLAAMIVGGLIIRSGVNLYKPAIFKLTDASVDPETIDEIRSVVREVPGAQNPHHIMSRMIGSETLSIELDIRADGMLTLFEAHQIAEEAEDALINHFGTRTHVIVHIEPSHPYRYTRAFMERRPDLISDDAGSPLPEDPCSERPPHLS